MQLTAASPIVKNAKKNYETYLNYYKNKNLTPMTFEEFLKNYATGI